MCSITNLVYALHLKIIQVCKFIIPLFKVVMIPAKEAKLLTYQLMENNFICLQELRKTVGASSVPSKALYLFYINFDQVN